MVDCDPYVFILFPLVLQTSIALFSDWYFDCYSGLLSAKMSIHRVLNQALKDILRVISPTQEDLEIRYQIVGDLRRAVETVESLRGVFSTSFAFQFLSFV